MIDLITGHQGFAHITAEQVANVNNAMTSGYGTDCVLRLIDGLVTSDGLSIGVGIGYWRANGFDMEITAPETIYIDPSSVGTSRIDNFYVEILQDIASGNQRSELVYVKGTEASVPTPPADPTAPQLTTDIMLQCVQFAAMTVSENTATLTDLTKEIEQVAPEDMALVKAWIRDNADVYVSLISHKAGEVVLNALDGKIYVCTSNCGVGDWETNKSHFTEKTIVSILNDVSQAAKKTIPYSTCTTAASTTAKTVSSDGFTLETGAKIYVRFSYGNTASAPTLNVNSTGAKTIKASASTLPSSWWGDGEVVQFVYDGSYWIMLPAQGQLSNLNNALSNKVDNSTSQIITSSTKFSDIVSKIKYKYNRIPRIDFGYNNMHIVTQMRSYSDVSNTAVFSSVGGNSNLWFCVQITTSGTTIGTVENGSITDRTSSCSDITLYY